MISDFQKDKKTKNKTLEPVVKHYKIYVEYCNSKKITPMSLKEFSKNYKR